MPRSPLTRTSRFAALLAVPVIAGAALALGLTATAPAQAAEVDSAITGVQITPTTPVQGSQLTTAITWCVPDGTQAGDTFRLQLSSHLQNLPTGFALNDPDSGEVVATAAIAGTPSWITFTMTDYASTHLDTCGTAFVRSDFDGTTTPSDVPTPFTSTTGDGRTFTTVVTPTGPYGDHAQPGKFGAWTRADQGHTNPTDFLAWYLDTPQGPFSGATSVDSVPAGQPWTYDCARIAFQTGHIVSGALDIDGSVANVTWTCDPTGFSVTWPAQTAGEIFRVTIPVSIPTATGTADAQTYRNDATVTTTVGGASTVFTAHAALVQATAGGTGDGTPVGAGLSVTKADTAGNAADTDGTAATLDASGATGLVYRVTNTGTEPLTDVDLADTVLANGTVTGLSCDFSPLGGPAGGTTWSGTIPVGAVVDCTAALTAVLPGGADHHDRATVTAAGTLTGDTVTASNDYFARIAVAGAVAPAAAAGSGDVAGSDTDLGGDFDSADVSGEELAYTGSDPSLSLGIAGVFLALGAAALVAARRRARPSGR